MRKLARLAAVASLAYASVARPVVAQSLQVSPVLLEMPPNKHGAVLQIRNTAATPVDIQVRPYDWRQVDGRDQFVDSTTLRVSPSIVTIPGGATQTLRLLAPDSPRTSEADWRLLVDQLPQIAPGAGLQIRLRMSILVFAYATKVAAADLRWRMIGGRLEASNVGPRYARLADLMLRRAGGSDQPLPLGEMPYLLPGSTRQWDIGIASTSDLTVVGRNGAIAFSAPIARETGH